MLKIERLKEEAKVAMEFRLHDVGRWVHYGTERRKATAMTACKKCCRQAFVDPYPAPNGIEVSGEAVAVGCDVFTTKEVKR